MNRRQFLSSLGAISATGLTGCTAPGTTPNDGSQQPADEPTLGDLDFQADNPTCGSGDSTQQVAPDITAATDINTVTISGTLSLPNPCYTLLLGNSNYDSDTDTLHVEVVAQQDSSGDVCMSCVGEANYTATASFNHDLPSTVVVAEQTPDGTHSTTFSISK